MRLLTTAVITALEAGGRRIGDAQAPANTTRPYAVVYPLFVSDMDGPIDDVAADGWYWYQVTSVGDTREQTQGLADELNATILGSTLAVASYAVGPIQKGEVAPIERDDDEQPPLFYQTIAYQIFVTPDP